MQQNVPVAQDLRVRGGPPQCLGERQRLGRFAGEDEVRRAERELEDLTHTYVAQVDELLKHKEAELLEV